MSLTVLHVRFTVAAAAAEGETAFCVRFAARVKLMYYHARFKHTSKFRHETFT
jgi:hypothetical protein